MTDSPARAARGISYFNPSFFKLEILIFLCGAEFVAAGSQCELSFPEVVSYARFIHVMWPWLIHLSQLWILGGFSFGLWNVGKLSVSATSR